MFYGVDGGNGQYNYSSDTWNQMMSGGYGGGMTDGPNNEILCADGSICGHVWSFMAGSMLPTSAVFNGQVDIALQEDAPNNGTPQQPQPPKPEPKPGWCTALVHAGNTTVGLGGVVFLWGTLADAGVVTAPAGVVSQASGGIGMAVGGIGIWIGDTGQALGICH